MRHEQTLDALEDAEEMFVAEWLVAVGDTVKQGEPILEVITDKANVEIAADVGGTLLEQCVAAEQRVASGDLLAIFDADATPPAGG